MRENVAVLHAADLAPLEVVARGTPAERRTAGEAIDAGEAALMERALAENAVIVAQMTPLFDA
jgi:hypothetical protein